MLILMRLAYSVNLRKPYLNFRNGKAQALNRLVCKVISKI